MRRWPTPWTCRCSTPRSNPAPSNERAAFAREPNDDEARSIGSEPRVHLGAVSSLDRPEASLELREGCPRRRRCRVRCCNRRALSVTELRGDAGGVHRLCSGERRNDPYCQTLWRAAQFRLTVFHPSFKLRALAKRAQMSPARILLVSALFSAYLVAQAHQIVTGSDDWPLSSFPMYSGTQSRHAVRHELVGVSPEGEFRLTREHIRPFSKLRLRHLLNHVGNGRHTDALNVFTTRYHQERKQHPAWPELVALRRYEKAWLIQPGLKGIERPRERLRDATLTLSHSRRAELEQQSKRAAGSGSPQTAGPNAIVLSAATAEVFGDVKTVQDRNAQGGVALRFGRGPRRKPKPRSKDAARFRFEAANAGTYYVWLRGKSSKGKRADSVWVALAKPGKSEQLVHSNGMGHFRDGLPAGAFAWSSVSPAHPPAKLRLSAGPQELVLTPREGPVLIDQVVLSRVWRERPPHEGSAIHQ